ncbi:hypothetical protein BS78_08G020100 [Paspalum vaginatum]|nr:hypothetical protein BS78_08G020100 [Paspalum vaginatum]
MKTREGAEVEGAGRSRGGSRGCPLVTTTSGEGAPAEGAAAGCSRRRRHARERRRREPRPASRGDDDARGSTDGGSRGCRGARVEEDVAGCLCLRRRARERWRREPWRSRRRSRGSAPQATPSLCRPLWRPATCCSGTPMSWPSALSVMPRVR